MIIPEDKYEFWWLMTTGEFPIDNIFAYETKPFKVSLHMRNNGYVGVCFSCDGKEVRAFEHRIIMEEYLCRKLSRSEDIHHINGDKKDNRLANLFLCNRKEHFALHPGKGKGRRSSSRPVTTGNQGQAISIYVSKLSV